jgi:ATP-binding cassette subfamily B multidrug efflux pump
MQTFHHLIDHFKKQRWLFAFGVAALLCTNYVQQFLPLLVKRGLDELQSAGPHAVPAARAHALLMVVVWLSLRLALVALQGALRYGWRMGFFGMSRLVEYGLRGQLFGKLLTLQPSFFRRMRVGELLSRATSDLAAIRESLGFGWLSLFDGVSTVGFTVYFMARADANLTWIILLPMLGVPVLVVTLGRKVRELDRQAQLLLDGFSQTATESFSGVRVIHAFAQQKPENARFADVCRGYRDQQLRLIKVDAFYWPLLTLLSGASELLLYNYGGARVAAHAMTVGDFAMFQDYLGQILWPVMALGVSSNMYLKGQVSMERLNQVLDADAEIVDPPLDEPVAPLSKGTPVLELRGLRFGYEGGDDVLRGVDLRLDQGQWLGLAGRTGCGKSTLLRLVPRLADPRSGQVLLWGRNLRQWPLKALRRRMSMVAQEPFLFSETLLENIAFSHDGDPEELRAEALEAALAAGLGETLAGLPLGLDTLLGEKGVNLSGGQKQRVALARALFVKPDLLLLDDAFSAVDTATEESIVSGLRANLPKTAVLMVSHRVSTLKLCDRVLLLEHGRVESEGSPQDLLQQEGAFFEMARREQLARRAGLGA